MTKVLALNKLFINLEVMIHLEFLFYFGFNRCPKKSYDEVSTPVYLIWSSVLLTYFCYFTGEIIKELLTIVYRRFKGKGERKREEKDVVSPVASPPQSRMKALLTSFQSWTMPSYGCCAILIYLTLMGLAKGK